MHLNKIATILKHIGEENRLKIMCVLVSNKNLCVSDIAKKLSLSVASTSHHLRTLEKNNILISSKEGKEVCYRLVDSPIIKDIKKLFCKYAF